MSHKRKAIKDNIAAELIDNVTEAVFKARYLPMSQREMPAICVYTPNEPAERLDSDEGYKRTCRVVVSGYVYGRDEIEMTDVGTADPEDIEDKLDEISTNIENTLLKKHQTLDGEILALYLTNTEYFVNSEGNQITAIAILEFDAIYFDDIA